MHEAVYTLSSGHSLSMQVGNKMHRSNLCPLGGFLSPSVHHGEPRLGAVPAVSMWCQGIELSWTDVQFWKPA